MAESKNVDFNCGDVVCMRSGGPAMTVEDPNPGMLNVRCVWFGNTAEFHEAQFLKATLYLMEKKQER